MDPRTRSQLTRANAQSRTMITDARKSCDDSITHIEDSRRLVAQSLQLLRRPVFGLTD